MSTMRTATAAESMDDTPEADGGGKRDGTQAIGRALDILTLLALGNTPNRGLKVSEITTYLGLSRPTVHRILTTLVDRGFAHRVRKSGRYILGDQISLLALARERKSQLVTIAEPFLQEISRIVSDTVFLSIRNGGDVLTVARVMGDFPIQVLSIDVGDRRPLGAITSGVAMLTRLSDDEATRLVLQDRVRLAAFGTVPEEVVQMVRDSRPRGFVYRQKGLIPGTKAIAVPVGGPDDPVAAAVTVSGMAKRMTVARVNDIIGDLIAQAEAMAARIRVKLPLQADARAHRAA